MAGVPLQAVGRAMSRQEAMALLNLTKKPPARRGRARPLLKTPVDEQDG